MISLAEGPGLCTAEAGYSRSEGEAAELISYV